MNQRQMARSVRISRIRSLVARSSHTFIIEDFLSQIGALQPISDSKTFISAKFLARDDKSSLDVELQIVVEAGLKSQSDSHKDKYVAMYLSLLPRYGELTLQIVDEDRPGFPVKYQFWLLDNCNKVLQESYELHGKYDWSPNELSRYELNMKEFNKDPTQFLRPDKSLAVRCLVEFDCGTELVTGSTAPMDPKRGLNQRLSSDIYPDMYLVSGETRLPCHKHMLAACSEVFNAMFSHVNKETTFNEVVIEDVDLTVLKKMLEFIYTDDIKDYEGLADKLIFAADKYDMTNLKTIAVNEAIRKFTVDNVCQFIILAGKVRSQFLKHEAMKFARAHIEEIMETNGWKTTSSTSIVEIIIEVLKSSL